jgi:antitoxin FitA
MHNACMVALQIRDVPVEVRDILAERARETGKSLQAFLLGLVTTEAERSKNIALLRSFEDRSDGVDSTMDQTVAEIEAAREGRDR